MFESLSKFIGEIVGAEKETASFDETETRLAAAALLVHVVVSDNEFNPAERGRLRDVLSYRFAMEAGDAEKLIEAATRADNEAVDLYQFTSVLNRLLDDEGRKRVVEMMFEVAYADGELSEFEDNVVWRASELLHIPARDRVTIRKHMRDEITDKENQS